MIKQWRYIFVLTVTFLVLMSSICMANVVPKEQFNIGGVTLDSTQAYVESIYGKPTKERSGGGPFGATVSYYYGDSFFIKFTEPSPYTATDVSVSANNGISTAAGIHVGSDVMDVRKAYGQPIRTHVDPKNKNISYWYLLQGGERTILYFNFDANLSVTSFGFALADGPSLAE